MDKEAKIIVVTNQKGGCGKTTLTMNIAGTMAKDYKVLIVNGDEQVSAIRWGKNNKEDEGFPATIIDLSEFKEQTHKEIKKHRFNYDYIFVDCPPAVDSQLTGSVLLIADLAIIPTIPSPTDIWATTGIEKLVKQVSTINEGLQSRFVINMCKNNKVSKSGVKALEKSFSIKRLNTIIYVRTAYEQAAAFGVTVNELDNEKAKIELSGLIEEIKAILNIGEEEKQNG
jgi:chromosome partitioning protein